MYKIDYDIDLEKVLKDYPKYDREKIVETIGELAENPRPHGYEPLKGKFRGYFRVRYGNYRIIYVIIEKKLLVLIVEIANRKEVYKKK
jgi:mRNA interferase RelE/StbE